MGSFVSTAKKVAAFRGQAGKIGYLLFEEGYSKNTHPHTPSWNCVGIGYIEDVVQRIFKMASSCEGGSLQHRGGPVTPETYVERWFEQLAEPVQMYNLGGVLKFESRFYATLPNEHKDKIVAAVTGSGFPTLIPQMESEGYEATLYEDFDLLRAVYSVEDVGAWRFVRSVGSDQPVAADLGYVGEPNGLPTLRIPRMFRFSGHTESLLVEQEDGTYRAEGWAYSVIGDFVAGYGPVNMKHPGSFRRVFAAYRDAARNAPMAPDDAVVVLELPAGDGARAKWNREDLDFVVARIPMEAGRKHLTMGELRQADQAHSGSNLVWKMERINSLVWTIPQDGEGSTGAGLAGAGMAQPEAA